MEQCNCLLQSGQDFGLILQHFTKPEEYLEFWFISNSFLSSTHYRGFVLVLDLGPRRRSILYLVSFLPYALDHYPSERFNIHPLLFLTVKMYFNFYRFVMSCSLTKFTGLWRRNSSTHHKFICNAFYLEIMVNVEVKKYSCSIQNNFCCVV